MRKIMVLVSLFLIFIVGSAFAKTPSSWNGTWREKTTLQYPFVVKINKESVKIYKSGLPWVQWKGTWSPKTKIRNGAKIVSNGTGYFQEENQTRKTFTYRNGRLTFVMRLSGKKTTIHVKK